MKKYHRKCVRCAVSFLGTQHMLVCGYCYGTQEDIELAEFIEDYKHIAFNPSLRKIQRILDKIENSTCLNDKSDVY